MVLISCASGLQNTSDTAEGSVLTWVQGLHFRLKLHANSPLTVDKCDYAGIYGVVFSMFNDHHALGTVAVRHIPNRRSPGGGDLKPGSSDI